MRQSGHCSVCRIFVTALVWGALKSVLGKILEECNQLLLERYIIVLIKWQLHWFSVYDTKVSCITCNFGFVLTESLHTHMHHLQCLKLL